MLLLRKAVKGSNNDTKVVTRRPEHPLNKTPVPIIGWYQIMLTKDCRRHIKQMDMNPDPCWHQYWDQTWYWHLQCAPKQNLILILSEHVRLNKSDQHPVQRSHSSLIFHLLCVFFGRRWKSRRWYQMVKFVFNLFFGRSSSRNIEVTFFVFLDNQRAVCQGIQTCRLESWPRDRCIVFRKSVSEIWDQHDFVIEFCEPMVWWIYIDASECCLSLL